MFDNATLPKSIMSNSSLSLEEINASLSYLLTSEEVREIEEKVLRDSKQIEEEQSLRNIGE